jgi:hypothetical protein
MPQHPEALFDPASTFNPFNRLHRLERGKPLLKGTKGKGKKKREFFTARARPL